ncbi:hypothetical protein FUAX_43470 (plasmid) [Fulvitalea axinellae]|uniref:Uncharacterized protein n=1 Tax=Fulvitalea axinellae TaxID=1182444 RepID=A0AAU9CRA0_9BACT|nr:hypothetical protein FUAX_43470 [Fulvitalea axinellae]
MYYRKAGRKGKSRGQTLLAPTDGVVPIQAMMLQARARRRTPGYFRSGDGFELNPKIFLTADQPLALDGDTKTEKGEDEDKVVWYQAYAHGVYDDFWVPDTVLEMTESNASFREMMDVFEEVWTQRYRTNPKYTGGYGVLQKDLYSLFVKIKGFKPRFGETKQFEIHQGIMDLLMRRPPDTRLSMQYLDSKKYTFKHSELATARQYKNFRPGHFMNIFGRSEEDGLSEAAAPKLEPRSLPFQYDIALNVIGSKLLNVLRELIPFIDRADRQGATNVSKISISPLQNLHSRPDTIVIRIVSEAGFRRVKEFVESMIRRHPDYFGEDNLLMTERFAKGAGWSHDARFENVWEMDDRMLASVGRFLERVSGYVTEHEANKFFFDWKGGQWRELEQLRQRVNGQLTEMTKGKAVDKKDLKRMHQLCEGFGKAGLSGQVVDWIEHFEKHQQRLVSGERYGFLGLRMQIMADLAKKKLRKRSLAIRTAMRLFERYGVDFFRPNFNSPIPPFTDDDMVLVGGEESEGLWGTDGVSSPEAVPFLTEPEPKPKEKPPADTEFWGREMEEFTPDEARVRDMVDNVTKAFVMSVAGDERQRLKVDLPEKEEAGGD